MSANIIEPTATARERLEIQHKGEDTARPGMLTLVCRKCTKLGKFVASDRALANMEARRAGWHYERDGKCVCPRCPR